MEKTKFVKKRRQAKFVYKMFSRNKSFLKSHMAPFLGNYFFCIKKLTKDKQLEMICRFTIEGKTSSIGTKICLTGFSL